MRKLHTVPGYYDIGAILNYLLSSEQNKKNDIDINFTDSVYKPAIEKIISDYSNPHNPFLAEFGSKLLKKAIDNGISWTPDNSQIDQLVGEVFLDRLQKAWTNKEINSEYDDENDPTGFHKVQNPMPKTLIDSIKKKYDEAVIILRTKYSDNAPFIAAALFDKLFQENIKDFIATKNPNTILEVIGIDILHDKPLGKFIVKRADLEMDKSKIEYYIDTNPSLHLLAKKIELQKKVTMAHYGNLSVINDPIKTLLNHKVITLTGKLNDYILERKQKWGGNSEYNKWSLSCFNHPHKSLKQKEAAVIAFKAALLGEKVDLLAHLDTLRDGELGETIRAFVLHGDAAEMMGVKRSDILTVRDFVYALHNLVNPENQVKQETKENIEPGTFSAYIKPTTF